ncbi:shikimate kinase [Marinoscillum pacificum]|uniref:shikimate kinase n=1 Tax=Marinoscillum pacificum TaxID=392723 RepID=UPI0021586B8D|nr:shikimate kinase [Marinoscillum pacificum]
MKTGIIYLVGMPGCGKSYFGKKLATELDCALIDLDKVIEEKEGMEIAEIFSSKGEDYFRKIENEVLKETTNECEFQIISTGGGTPCFHDGIDYMNQHGITVFLETERELLIERIARKSHRPLMQGDTEARVDKLLKTRLPIYKKAQISIAHREVDLLLNDIKNLS